MNIHSPFSLIVVANEHCARFLKFLRDDNRLIEQVTLANPNNEQADTARFAHQIAQQIEAKCAADEDIMVCLIAPGPFLQVLQGRVDQNNPGRIAATREADLTALSEDHILVRITDLITTLAKD